MRQLETVAVNPNPMCCLYIPQFQNDTCCTNLQRSCILSQGFACTAIGHFEIERDFLQIIFFITDNNLAYVKAA